MSDLNPTDYAGIRSCYQYLGVEALTTQQEMFLLTHLRGVSIAAAARAAGMTPQAGRRLMAEERVETIQEFFRAQMFRETRIELDMLNNMTLEAHRKSANATEEIKAVETLARLNQIGGYAPAPVLKAREEMARERERDVTPKNQKQLERMPHDKLVELAGIEGLDSLYPQAPEDDTPDEGSSDAAIEAEYEETAS